MGKVVKNSMAERTYRVANKLNVPKVTVERVIHEYLDDIKESLKRGETVSVDRLFTIKAYMEDGSVKVRGQVSAVLKEQMKSVKGLSIREDDK